LHIMFKCIHAHSVKFSATSEKIKLETCRIIFLAKWPYYAVDNYIYCATGVSRTIFVASTSV